MSNLNDKATRQLTMLSIVAKDCVYRHRDLPQEESFLLCEAISFHALFNYMNDIRMRNIENHHILINEYTGVFAELDKQLK